ncbi:MAG: DUF2220 family protein [Oscillospiraceae bacterium]|nr:DUF2220 family protein [Oscillospiraceae bacterium]
MDYAKDILNRLIDMYERRGAFHQDASTLRAIRLEIKKVYPAYVDRYDHDEYKNINVAIEKLSAQNLVISEQNNAGKYEKVQLNVFMVEESYRLLKRIGIPEQCEKVQHVLEKYENTESLLVQNVNRKWTELIADYKKLPYDLKYDSKKIDDVLRVLIAITKLDKETYIRNFSTALFKDSKKFQNEYRSTIESILFDYTDEVLEKDKILEFYNLYENPTYVLIKGDVAIHFETSVIDVSEMPDGIALSNASLEKIKSIIVNADKVITVENLTTYHDADEDNSIHVYLGGYHNHSKQMLLEKIYSDNHSKAYFHMGDLDVYGFLILENLKEKTGIPFRPLMMDARTLERFYKAGMYKELTTTDKKMILEKKDTKLAVYAEVLQFMLDNNCKVEQESIKAVELME